VKQNRRRNFEDLAVVQLVPAAVLGPSLQIIGENGGADQNAAVTKLDK
jgi:hypothetical protein